MFKNFFRFFLSQGKQLDDIKPLTDYLKNNNHFVKGATKIHVTKETLKDRISKGFDSILEDEDGIKRIEDKSQKKLK
jgi:hypothetical protein